MNIKKKNLILGALALASALGAINAQAATQTLCETIARPAGYLSVEINIPNSRCPTGKSIKWATPSNGLTILQPTQLEGMTPPYRVNRVNQNGANQIVNYGIGQVTNGGTFCVIGSEPYNFFTEVGGYNGACREGSSSIPNTRKFYQTVETSLAVPTSGAAAKVVVALNAKLSKPALNYAVRTTANLNGQLTTVSQPGFTKSGQYTLKQVAPSLVEKAEQGASFSFQVVVFDGPTAIADSTTTASGAQLIGN